MLLTRPDLLTISRYKGGRHWAVREADTGSLVVVTLYRKGAVEVVIVFGKSIDRALEWPGS